MTTSGSRRITVASSLEKGARSRTATSRYQHERRFTATSWVGLLLVIAVMSGWAHYRPPTEQLDSPDSAATLPPGTSAASMRLQLGAWLTEPESSIQAVVTARNNIAAAAHERDIPGTGAACRSASGAVVNLERQMPSPAPELNSPLQRAIDNYDVGLAYCAFATQTLDGQGMERAATYITQGDDAMRAALDIIEQIGPEPRNIGVLIV